MRHIIAIMRNKEKRCCKMLSRNYEIYSCNNKVNVRLKFTIMRNSHIWRYNVPIVIEKKSQLREITV